MSADVSYLHLLMQENELSKGCLMNNLNYLDESRLFIRIDESGKLADVVSTINSKLHSTGKDRIRALLLLEKFLPQCSSDTFAEYSAGWMQQCCKLSQPAVNDELRILRYLVENSVRHPDLKKQVVANVLPRFAERLMCSDDVLKLADTAVLRLRCLKSFVIGYSSSCGPFRGSFYKFTMYCLREYQEQQKVIREAAMCYVALCQCGSKGQQGINYKEVWSSNFEILINTCHKLIDTNYSNIDFVSLVSISNTDNACPGLLEMKPEYEKTPMMRYHGLKIGFGVVSELLRAMLLCKFSVSKSFQPNEVFNLICRVLSVTGDVLRKCVQTNDILAVATNIPDIHARAFDILKAMIISCKRNLIPYGALICKLCLQSLKWTHSSEWNYGSSKPYESLRSKVYSVLLSWLSVSGSCSSIEIFADEIIPIVISDIEFVKPSVKLTVSTKPNTKRNKRKRSQLVTEMNMKSESVSLIDPVANKGVCLEAHRALQSLLRSASVLIKWEHHKNLQYVILPLLLEIFDRPSTGQYPLPYSNVNCRLELFKSFFTLVSEPHPKWTAPVSLAGRILSVGANDSDVEVASFCKFASSQLEIMIHPRCPTLYFTQHENKDQTAAVSRSSDWFPKNEISVPRVDPDPVTVNEADEMVVNEGTCPVIDNVVSECRSQHFDLPAESLETPATLANTKITDDVVKESVAPICTPIHSETSQNPVALETIGNRGPTSEKKMTAVLASPEGKRNESSIASKNSEEKMTAVLASPERKRSEFSVANKMASARESSQPPCKKLKSDLVDDEQVQSMLDDFVDTLA